MAKPGQMRSKLNSSVPGKPGLRNTQFSPTETAGTSPRSALKTTARNDKGSSAPQAVTTSGAGGLDSKPIAGFPSRSAASGFSKASPSLGTLRPLDDGMPPGQQDGMTTQPLSPRPLKANHHLPQVATQAFATKINRGGTAPAPVVGQGEHGKTSAGNRRKR